MARLSLFLAPLLLSPAPAFAQAVTTDVAAAAPACAADADRSRTSAAFQQGLEDLQKDANFISQEAEKTATLVAAIANNAAKCEPSYGPQVYQAIASNSDGTNLLQKIREVGAKTQDAAMKMAASVQAAKAKYAALDFCNVTACTGSFDSLSGMFTPVASQSKISLATIRTLKQEYIDPADRKLTERQKDIEWVLSGPACNRTRAAYQEALARWKGVEQRIAEMEKKIAHQNAVAWTVMDGAAKGKPACGLAQR